MKRLLLAISVLSFQSIAADGFFGPVERASIEPEVALPVSSHQSSCALQLRYNTAQPTWIHLRYTGATTACNQGFEPAIQAAVAAIKAVPAKSEIGSRPAIPPVFECGIDVSFETEHAASPQVSFVGAANCEATRARAVNFAAGLVACAYRPVRCPISDPVVPRPSAEYQLQ